MCPTCANRAVPLQPKTKSPPVPKYSMGKIATVMSHSFFQR